MIPFPFRHHIGPGRRIAKNSTKGDHILALFGFVSHAAFFVFLTSLSCSLFPSGAKTLAWTSGGVAAALLVLRASQVGLTTTKESIQAIKDAWTTNWS